MQPPAVWAREENTTNCSPESWPEVLGLRCHLYSNAEMMGVSLAQVACYIRAAKNQLVQLWLLFTTSPLEVITISDLLTELLMGMLPKPLLSKDILLANTQEFGYLHPCGSNCLGSFADSHTISRSTGIKIFRGHQWCATRCSNFFSEWRCSWKNVHVHRPGTIPSATALHHDLITQATSSCFKLTSVYWVIAATASYAQTALSCVICSRCGHLQQGGQQHLTLVRLQD